MGLLDRKQPPQRERTQEERERARAERAARRAARAGQPQDATPPPLEVPPPEPGAASPSQPAQPPRPTPPQTQPTAPDPIAAPRPEARPSQVPSQPETRPSQVPSPAAAVPSGTGPRGATAAPPRERPAVRPSEPSVDGDGDGDGRALDGAPPRPARRDAPTGADAPSTVIRDTPSEDWSAVDSPARVPLGERLRRRRAGAPPPAAETRSRRIFPLIFVAALAAVVIAAGWFLVKLFQPGHGEGSGRVSVVVPRGASVGDAGELLADRGIVDSAFFFKLRAKLDGPSDIKPGTYLLPKDMSYAAAFDALAAGPPKPKTTDITLTEGRTITEANRLLRKTSLRGSYAAAVRRSRVLRPQQYGAPRNIRTREGFLFPATYQVGVGAPVSDLVTKQLQTFRKRFATLDLSYARSKKLTPYDVLIIASMIEREAAVAKDRPLIASVIYNRLHQGIPLGIDATIRYRLDNWSRPLRESELNTAGPYNTRSHQGLPPTPIGNPGLASIRAAARPARTQYLYFVVKPCGRGEHAFQKTDAEFQRAAQNYEQARQAKGGSPVDC